MDRRKNEIKLGTKATRRQSAAHEPTMKELFRSNDAVRLSYAEALLKEQGLTPIVLDHHMSILDGSIGALPRRLVIADKDHAAARRVLIAAGVLEHGPGEGAPSIEALGSLTDDKFLGGRVSVLQPEGGFRAAIDSVLLPAAVERKHGETVLDAGIGSGVASLCLLARDPSFRVTGLEVLAPLTMLACENARRNGFKIEVIERDLFDSALDDKRPLFDQVMTNPPYQEPHQGTPPPDALKARAHVLRGEGRSLLARWISACLMHLNARGTLTLIHRADRTIEITEILSHVECAVAVLPLLPRAHLRAKRILVRARLGAHENPRILPGLVLHGESEKYTPAAERILRDAAPVDWGDYHPHGSTSSP
jgi:tRNA1(Val) A37 N6-methylase TrmN6